MAYIPYAMQKDAVYVITAPSGLRAVLNDPADVDYVGVVQEVTGLDSAEVRESASDAVEADGGAHGAFYFGRRPISLTVRFYGHSTMAQRDARVAKLQRVVKECMRADGIISWRNKPTASSVQMQTYVRLQQPPRRGTPGWVQDYQIQLVSAFAPLFGSTLNSSSVIAANGSLALENKGDYPAFPLITFTGASANPSITQTGGPVFRTQNLTLATGETVQFDMLSHSGRFTAGVRTGQSANRYINFDTTGWPYLVPGINPSAATNTTFTNSASGTATVAWRDTWG